MVVGENEITLIIVWSGRSGKAVCVEWILGVFVGVGVCVSKKMKKRCNDYASKQCRLNR